jgi:hypothetical protein
MGVVGAGDIDQIDFGRGNQFAPIRFKSFISPVRGEGFGAVRVARTDFFKDGPLGQIEELRRMQKRVRVRTAHKAASDYSDIECFRH